MAKTVLNITQLPVATELTDDATKVVTAAAVNTALAAKIIIRDWR